MCMVQVTAVQGSLSPQEASTSYRCGLTSLMEAQSSSGQREAQQPPGCSEIAMGQPLMSREKPSLKSMTFSQDIKQNKIVS